LDFLRCSRDEIAAISGWVISPSDISWHNKKRFRGIIREAFGFYSQRSIIGRVKKSRRRRLAGHVARVEVVGETLTILVRNPEWEKPLGRPRCTREDNIKLYFHWITRT
jgi:hypothetical protein